MRTSSPLISPKEITLGAGTIIIDARSGVDAFERYKSSHLAGAFHADLDHDLAKKPADPAMGGRHPLPEVKDFAAYVGKLGITPSTSVVVYDDKSGANAAARFWWMLRALGHDKIQVVDGGLAAIIRDGLSLESGSNEPSSTAPYPSDRWQLPTVSIDEVKTAAKDPQALVIDVREAYRYRGDQEPIDLVAGHIPGAVNIPYINNLSDDGTFRAADDLAALYHQAVGHRDPSRIVVHCGSGVTACHTLLALDHAGIKGANLYVGSWSEWSRRNLPIAKGDS